MNLDRASPLPALLAAILGILFAPVFYPSARFAYFIPYLVWIMYQKPIQTCLWIALLVGLFLDLFTVHEHVGLYSSSYVAATLMLYHQKTHFFADRPTTLPMLTCFFSILSTAFQVILIYTFEHEMVFTWKWIVTDLIYMPLCDSAYSSCLFVIPYIMLGKPKRRGQDYFFG